MREKDDRLEEHEEKAEEERQETEEGAWRGR